MIEEGCWHKVDCNIWIKTMLLYEAYNEVLWVEFGNQYTY